MPAFDQQALVDLFRQSFSPLTQLGAGRLQMEQAALERDYAQQAQAAAMAERYRQHIAGLQEQDRLARTSHILSLQEQDKLQRARATQALEDNAVIEQLRAQNDLQKSLAVAGAGMQGNRKLAQESRAASEFERARTLAAGAGIELDPTDSDYVNKVTTAVAKQNATHRKSATEYQRELNGLTDQLQKLSDSLDLPEARQVTLAKPILLSLADPKQAAALKKLTTLDDVLAAAADVPGATEKIVGLLQKEQQTRSDIFKKKSLPLQTRQSQLQRTLQGLELKGISPDYEALKMTVSPAAEGADPAELPTAGAASSTLDLSGVVPPPPAAATSPASDGTTNWLAPSLAATGAATLAARKIAESRAFIGPQTPSLLSRAAAPMGNAAKYVGSRVLRPTNLNPALAAATIAEGINSAPTMWGSEPLTASLAGLATGTLGDEYYNQRNLLQRIDRLMPRVDPTTALRLRAMKFAPKLPDNAELDALIRDFGPPSNSGMPVGLQPLY